MQCHGGADGTKSDGGCSVQILDNYFEVNALYINC